jgi:hypothetical protein
MAEVTDTDKTDKEWFLARIKVLTEEKEILKRIAGGLQSILSNVSYFSWKDVVPTLLERANITVKELAIYDSDFEEDPEGMEKNDALLVTIAKCREILSEKEYDWKRDLKEYHLDDYEQSLNKRQAKYITVSNLTDYNYSLRAIIKVCKEAFSELNLDWKLIEEE